MHMHENAGNRNWLVCGHVFQSVQSSRLYNAGTWAGEMSPFTVIIHPINEFVVYLCMFQGNKTCNINKECCLHCLTLELLDDCVGLTVLVSLRPLVSTEIWLCIHTVLCCTLEELARRLCLQKPSGSIRAEYFLKVHHTPVCKPLHEWLRCQHEEIWRVFLIFSRPQMPVVDGNHWISQDMILERFSNISMQSYDDKKKISQKTVLKKAFLVNKCCLLIKSTKYVIYSVQTFSVFKWLVELIATMSYVRPCHTAAMYNFCILHG